ncbi:MAG: RNA 2',3'-cyclic phosphodiesterase [bacterium]
MREKTDLDDERWRVFCAIGLPRDLHERLTTHINRIRDTVPGARASWSRADNIHLTLKFLADTSLPQVERLSEAASRSVEDFAPFKIVLEQMGVFPSHGSPRVLWIGVNDLEGKLKELHMCLEDEASKSGFQKEPRPFHPHLTLARLRQPQHSRTLVAAHKAMEFEPAEIAVSELLIIRSELSSAGSKYTTISRHPLAAG